MAYDSKTYGQSPFGNAKQPNEQNPEAADSKLGTSGKPEAQGDRTSQRKPPEKSTQTSTTTSPTTKRSTADAEGRDQRAGQFSEKISEKISEKSDRALGSLANRFPSLAGGIKAKLNGPTPSADTLDTATEPVTSRTNRKPTDKPARSTRKSAPKTSTRKSSKNSKSSKSKAEQAEAEAAEQAIERRFWEEDRNAYLSLLYKTSISGLFWAVLRLVRYELSDRAIAILNLVIHPFVIAALAFACTFGLTFWTRHLLNDLARHTQQLHLDAEAPDSKTFRPTLEIVGDSLEYNPRLRKNFARLFNAASILVCSLVSYLITFALFPTR
ncbi:MAG: Protein of unknown function (DUF1356) [Phormidesmis priestleyi Ana]|uniref:Uncharacterized protein n=1 Tax=Phormidesmis priestleyi Ana TaxID=1666911 RepID=A0A0N8KNA3_9CYAN|nr:MAG: Protein of unknown function (DUF1356) [Phormidesmis priestleyi Ana]